MATIAERVRGLIQSTGQSQRAFGTAVGLDDAKLSKSLNGLRRFTSLELARIGAESSVSVDWLLTGREPELATAARSTGGTAATAVEQARRFSALRADMEFLGYSQPWRPLGVPTGGGRFIDQGHQLATAALAEVDAAGRSSTERELASVVEAVFGADVVVAELGPDFDGMAVSSPKVKLILAATSSNPARQRFTIAHELGHLLAEDDQELHLDADIQACSKKDGSEMRANAFAAAFLMPESVLHAAVNEAGLTREHFAALASELSVSPTTLAYRLQNLGLIDDATADRFRAMTGASAARLAGCGGQLAHDTILASSPRPPGLLVRDTYDAYDTGRSTLRPYASIMQTDVERLREALETDEHAVVAS